MAIRGLLIIAIDFTLLRREHLKSNEYECMGRFASSFLPLLTLDIADSGVNQRLNGCPTVFVGTVYVKLASALVSFSSVLLL